MPNRFQKKLFPGVFPDLGLSQFYDGGHIRGIGGNEFIVPDSAVDKSFPGLCADDKGG